VLDLNPTERENLQKSILQRAKVSSPEERQFQKESTTDGEQAQPVQQNRRNLNAERLREETLASPQVEKPQ